MDSSHVFVDNSLDIERTRWKSLSVLPYSFCRRYEGIL